MKTKIISPKFPLVTMATKNYGIAWPDEGPHFPHPIRHKPLKNLKREKSFGGRGPWAGWIFLCRAERGIQKSHSKLITTKGASLGTGNTAGSGEAVSPLKSTRGALPVINSPLQPPFLPPTHPQPTAAVCRAPSAALGKN